jgi:3-deoxy-D-manno-octulosonic-acid transferase
MYLLYSFAFTLLFLLLLPYFIYQAIRYGKYASSFKARLGWLSSRLQSDRRPTVWVHTVSVGEFLAAKPLLEELRRELSGWRIVVSTTTLTGQRLARAEPTSRIDAVCYFPFDWTFTVRRALNRIQPSLVVILETELWPNFLRVCREREVPTMIANGRLSPRSFARYRRVRKFIARALADVSLLVMQSEADAERARLLGARAERVRVCGNLKYDVPVIDEKSQISNLQSEIAEQIDAQFALSSSPHLIIAGSTAPGEESILLATLNEARKRPELADARLVIAPRHPERFNEVASLIRRSGLRLARRTEAQAIAATRAVDHTSNDQRTVTGADAPDADDPRAADVILLDTIGELAALYRFAAVVFVGGSLVPRGGHNIIEPAVYAKPIIVGPHTENFRQIVADFARLDAVRQIPTTGEGLSSAFAREMIRLLVDRESAQAMGERAREILLRNGGATRCTMTAIKEVLSAEC